MANVNTVGFKEDRVFRIPATPWGGGEEISSDSLTENPLNDSASPPVCTFTNFEQGHMKGTGNALDIALDGEGFFSIQTPEGIQYTRKGNFVLNSNGTLVTQGGYPVLGKGGSEILISGQVVVVGPAAPLLLMDRKWIPSTSSILQTKKAC